MSDKDDESPMSLSDLANLRKEVRELLQLLKDDPFPKEMKELLRALQSRRFQAEAPPDDRKYSYSRSNNELGYRLVLGQDPARVPDERLDEVSPISNTIIQGLLSDGDCPLFRVKVKGSAFVPESSVRQYERYLEEGAAPSYMQTSSRP